MKATSPILLFTNSKSLRPLLVETIALFFVVLWLYVSIDKLLHFHEFKRSMQMQEIPRQWLPAAYWGIPLTELLAALLLLLPSARKIGLILSVLLMTIFTTYMAYIVFGNFQYRPCSCAGLFSSMGWKQHLLLNSALLLLSLTAILIFPKPTRKEDAVTP